MPVFAYKAVDLDSSLATGTITADTPRQARDVLRARGLAITQIAPVAVADGLSFLERRRGRRSQADVVEFVRELSTLLQVGIPLLPALRTLAQQRKGHFLGVIQQLTDDVAAGVGLAEAMGRRSAYFDELCVSITRVGENTGGLETALKRLADFKEKAHRLRSRITSALIYPGVVCVFGIAVSVFLMTFVVPNLLNTLTQAGRELPAVTKIVKGVSDLLLTWWWALLLGVVAVVTAFQGILRTEKGRLLADRLVLRLPVLGELVRKENASRIAVVLETLLRSGLQFVEAIGITRMTVRNRVFRNALEVYRSAVTAGRDVAAPLAASGVFSPMVVQMLAVGQESGQLEDMLAQLAESLDHQVATATQRLTAALEPLMIVLLALLVGSIAFATILPILEVSNVL